MLFLKKFMDACPINVVKMNMVYVAGATVEGVNNIREAIFNHFSTHFKSLDLIQQGVQGRNFRKLSGAEAGNLTKPFSIAEVKQAVWDCDSFKSPGSDGVNFGFIKEFWDILRDNFFQIYGGFSSKRGAD